MSLNIQVAKLSPSASIRSTVENLAETANEVEDLETLNGLFARILERFIFAAIAPESINSGDQYVKELAAYLEASGCDPMEQEEVDALYIFIGEILEEDED